MTALRLADELRVIAQEERAAGGEKAGPEARPLKACVEELLRAGAGYLRDILVLGAGGPAEALTHRTGVRRWPAGRRRCRPRRRRGWSGCWRSPSRSWIATSRRGLVLERMFLDFVADPAPGSGS